MNALRRNCAYLCLLLAMLCLPSAASAAACTALSAGGVINTYYPGSTASVAVGATSIVLGAGTGSSSPIAIGDLLLIIQMQDATINNTNTDAYGDGVAGGDGSGTTGLGSSGLYEYALAASAVPIAGGTLTLSSGTVNAYNNAAAIATQGQRRYQVVRVPVFATDSLNAATPPTANAWNGATGGVLAFDVTGALALGGATVDLSGLGFRGGVGRGSTSGSGTNTDYRTPATNLANGSKGEGVAGTPGSTDAAGGYGYPNGSYARGAPANAGGGGTDINPTSNDENSGGGGGANSGSGGLGGLGWCPGFTTTAPYFGCGISTLASATNPNGSTGGFGGVGLTGLGATRLALGGGGGAGTTNNSTGALGALSSGGAPGGGLIFVRAGSLTGTATFNANGGDGNTTVRNDGSGGGGGGGAVLISAASGVGGVTINVNGGRGGDTLVPPGSTATPHGPGGGGGGGFAITSGAPAACSRSGGSNGLSYNNGALFGAYGAMPGGIGSCVSTLTSGAIPGKPLGNGNSCNIVDLAISMTRNSVLNPGQSSTYTLNVVNNGPAAETGPITVTDTLPAQLSYSSATGTGWSCGAAGQVVTCTRAGGLANGASAQPITLAVNVAAGAAGTKINTATVAGVDADSTPGNNTATDSYTIGADLAISIARGGPLVPGSNSTYLINVSNLGTSDEGGTITVTDTLPAGLTYVSAGSGGTGWTCGAVGQVVTCTRSGPLASGASTPSLTLTVAVAAGTTGTINNTVTVKGTLGFDPNTANDNATDSCTVGAYAYFQMDQASWDGTVDEVIDSSGNNRHASRIGGATVTTQPAPASGLKGDTCKGATIPLGTGAGTQMGVNTSINPNALGMGNAGTVSFWYFNNVAWTSAGDTNDRTLLDATGSAGTREFWLVLRQTGDLRFKLDNAGAASQTTTGNVKNGVTFGANTWHHIAITWDFTAHTMAIYVDGAQDAIRPNNGVTSETPNYGTFFIGDSKTTVYTNPPNQGNSANGVIDEVRFYNSAQSAAQILADMNATHACAVAPPNHLEIQHTSGTGLTCAASTLTIKACVDAAVPCVTPFTGGVSGTLSAAGTPTVSWNGSTGGAAGAGFVIPGGSSSVTKDVQVATAGTVTFGITSPAPVPTSATTCNFGTNSPFNNNCVFTASSAGFIFSDTTSPGNPYTIPTQISGTTTATLYLRAVQASATNPAVCTPAIISQTTSVNMGYACNNPTTCQAGNLATINATPIAGSANATPTLNSTPVSLTFNANGSAPITVRYDDAGQITLYANKSVTPFVGGTPVSLSGNSNAFVVKPAGFVLSGIAPTLNPAGRCTVNPNSAPVCAANATGSLFARAGEDFTVNVIALTSSGKTKADAGLAVNCVTVPADCTPNFGKESTPEGVRFVDTSLLATDPNYANHGRLVTGLGLTINPAIGGTFGAFGGGIASGTGFNWSEVGIITLTPALTSGNYLASGASAIIGTPSGNVGRFYPDHFDTFVIFASGVPMGCPTAGTCPTTLTYNGFAYSGQPFSTNVIARNLAGATTRNYNATSGFSKDVTLTAWKDVGLTGAANSNPGVGTLGPAPPNPVRTGFASGSATTATTKYTLPAPPPAPTNIYLRATDSDGVTSLLATPANSIEGGLQIATGRMLVANAYGSEFLKLPITVTAQYWNGTRYVTSTTDGSTSFASSDVGLANCQKNLSAGAGVCKAAPIVEVASPPTITLVAGVGSFILKAPGDGNNGSVDLNINAPTWLPSTTGRAAFGVYKAGPVIYIREVY
jgi:uncharacterized repeat protein (TIGR01451 family)